MTDRRTKPQITALAAIFDVRPATIRQWIRRGYLRRLPDGSIDLDSLRRHTEKRSRLQNVA